MAERLDLVRALGRLPKRQRQVVILRYLADRPEEEVARVLGCSVGAVKTHASRGLSALRAELGGR
jgi:RNA polymerase sigma factor (sigma-70 family)